jgi:hypothetical protein
MISHPDTYSCACRPDAKQPARELDIDTLFGLCNFFVVNSWKIFENFPVTLQLIVFIVDASSPKS